MSDAVQQRDEHGWWLEAGSETCDFCEVRFHYEIAVYCAGCDRTMCSLCVMFVARTAKPACPECAPALEKGEG